MDLAPRQRRPRAESIVPMINVVFLLLIFFLMTAQIAPPEPFEVTLPETDEAEAADAASALFVSADGVIGWQDLEGDAAIAAFVAEYASTDPGAAPQPAHLRADQAVPASVVAALLPKLAAAGLEQVILLTAAR